MAAILSDTVLPSILSDFDYLIEGAYEYDAVILKDGDIVFDLGANLGLFSSVAAAKRCQVYAFEPVPRTIGFLSKVAKLYPNITICPFAISDKTGAVSINVDGDGRDTGDNLGNSTLMPHDSFSTLEVSAITVDDFVEQKLPPSSRVDFIKADIEGAECMMLRGAQRTLARFGPKLALCTYHRPDDPQEMERLILQANPHYKIIHKWAKLYAYCP